MSQTKAQLIDPVDGTIVDADINASAAIAGTKISPSFTSDITVTNTAPTISFVDSNADSDFRIRINDGAFKIQDITNSGNSRLVIDSNGKVGIGTTSPTGLLSLSSNNPNIQFNDNDTSNNAEITLDNTGLRIESDESNAVSNSSINFRIDASEKARIDSSGNVGIGTSNPLSALHVRGSGTTNLRVDNSDDGTASLTLGNTGSSNLLIAQTSANATFSIGGTEFVRITSAGRLLINDDSSTNAKLVVVDTANQISLETGTSGDGRLNIGHFNNGTFIGTYGDDGGAADLIRFGTHSGDERMRIQSDGKVGIGTANPQRLLHQHEASSGANYHVFTNTTTGSSGTDGLLVGISADENALIWHYENQPIRFATNNTERMRIDSDGKVGIGTSSPGSELHVSALGASDEPTIRLASENSTIFLRTAGSSGSFPTGSGGNDGELTYIGGDFRLGIGTASKNLIFFNGSGYTERMRLDDSGALCVGVTAADANGSRLTLKSLNTESCCHMEKPFTGNKTILNLEHGRAVGSTTGNMIILRNSIGTNVGNIRSDVDSTSFNTTSDYRLKENAVSISDGITRLKTLKPYRFNFKASPSKIVDGFFAHEVSSAVPEAISEEKDGVITQEMIDSGDAPDGNLGDPIYQGIDQSKLVPLLTAALQEAITKIETLETKVAALEAA